MKKFLTIILLLLYLTNVNLSYEEEIFTTVRSDAHKTIFDGRWSFLQEWKSTSEDIVEFDDGKKLAIKTGHDYDNLYILVDFISDKSFSKFADAAKICLFNKSNETTALEYYCMMTSLESKNPITLKASNLQGENISYRKVQNHPSLIAIGGISDENDRYTTAPHTTYEFKIPIEILGRSSEYGFYVLAYDANTNRAYSWPKDINERLLHVPPPTEWGELISPDKSLPEFSTPFIILLVSTIFIFLCQHMIFKQTRTKI